MTFDIPGLGQARKRAAKDDALVRREVMGPAYELVMSNQRQAGEPQQIALREPDPYRHPRPLSGWVLDPGGPRIMPASQEIAHGDERNREEEFDQAVQQAAELGALHAVLGFRDRRFYPKPARVGGWQADVNTPDKLQRGF
jgi:hypothetical protein